MKGQILEAMMKINEGDVKMVNHALKVYAYAQTIALGEGLTGDELDVLESAAILHDIGIPQSRRVYQDSIGPHQEEQGKIVGARILDALGMEEEKKERVLFLIANHHSYGVKGERALQILFEADFIVNFDEGNLGDVKLETFKRKALSDKNGVKTALHPV